MKRLTLLLCACVTLHLACGNAAEKAPAAEKRLTAVAEAVKALRKVEAATQVGSTQQQYSQLVIDAKAQVNEASRLLPEGELKSELGRAVDAYADAVALWDQYVVKAETPLGRKLIERYGAEEKKFPTAPPLVMDRDGFNRRVWAVAGKHLERADALYKGQS